MGISDQEFRKLVEAVRTLNGEIGDPQRSKAALRRSELLAVQKLISEIKLGADALRKAVEKLSREIDQINVELIQIKDRIEAAEQLLTELEQNLSGLQDAVASLTTDIENLNYRTTQVEIQVTQIVDDVGGLQTDVAALALQTGQNAEFIESLGGADGSSRITYTQDGVGSIEMSVQDKLRDAISVDEKGASPSSPDNTQAILDAIAVAAARGGGDVWFHKPGVYLSKKITLPTGVVLRAKFGAVEIKLMDGENTPLLESLGFDSLYVTASTPGTDVYPLPYDLGFDGIIFNGNRDNQTVRVPLVKLYGARLHINGQIHSSKGPGLRTACFGAHSQSRKTPGAFKELEVYNCDEEGWIFEGPSDQYFGHLVMSVIGVAGDNGGTPQTSTIFPGEPVHGLRLQSGSMHVASMNINGTRFGRGIYLNGRVKFGDVISAGNWGNLYATASAFGSIGSLHVQANPLNWGGVVYPSVEINTDDLHLENVTALRVNGQDQPTAPLIVDNAGAQWGKVRNRQALAQGGTFFVANAPGVTIDALDAKGADIALHTTFAATRITVNCTFNNCNTVWKNEATRVRGAWDFSGSLEAGQVFATGIDAAPQADAVSLAEARIDFTLAGVWKSNSFIGNATFDALTTNGQTLTFNHNLWRTPTVNDITLTARVTGWTSEPAGLCLTINGFDATSIRARVKLSVAATGTPVGQVVCKVG